MMTLSFLIFEETKENTKNNLVDVNKKHFAAISMFI